MLAAKQWHCNHFKSSELARARGVQAEPRSPAQQETYAFRHTLTAFIRSLPAASAGCDEQYNRVKSEMIQILAQYFSHGDVVVSAQDIRDLIDKGMPFHCVLAAKQWCVNALLDARLLPYSVVGSWSCNLQSKTNSGLQALLTSMPPGSSF